jgi:hypothetical protein
MELDENAKVDVSLFAGSRSIAESIMQRPAYDAGSSKRPLLLEPNVGGGSNDDGVDAVTDAMSEKAMKHGYGVHLDKGVADCPFCEELRESENADLKMIHGISAAMMAAIAKIKTELDKHKTQWDELADAWVAVVNSPSLQNIQALKWYFGEWAFNEEENRRSAGAHLSIQYDKASTTVVMEIDGWVHTTTFEKSLDDLIVGT